MNLIPDDQFQNIFLSHGISTKILRYFHIFITISQCTMKIKKNCKMNTIIYHKSHLIFLIIIIIVYHKLH